MLGPRMRLRPVRHRARPRHDRPMRREDSTMMNLARRIGLAAAVLGLVAGAGREAGAALVLGSTVNGSVTGPDFGLNPFRTFTSSTAIIVDPGVEFSGGGVTVAI